jgi:hypothetical protein
MSHTLLLKAFKNVCGLLNHCVGYVGASWLHRCLEDGLMCVSFTQNHVNTELSAQIDEFRAKYPNVG